MSEEYKEDIDSEDDEQVVDTVDESTSEDSKEELTDREKQFLARAKKAEAKFKAVKDTVVETPEIKKVIKPTNHSTSEQVQREVFLATGGTLEELEVLDSIVGESLQEKKQNPLYVNYIATEETKKRDDQASLGTSKGGKRVISRELTRDEKIAAHTKRVAELMG